MFGLVTLAQAAKEASQGPGAVVWVCFAALLCALAATTYLRIQRATRQRVRRSAITYAAVGSVVLTVGSILVATGQSPWLVSLAVFIAVGRLVWLQIKGINGQPRRREALPDRQPGQRKEVVEKRWNEVAGRIKIPAFLAARSPRAQETDEASSGKSNSGGFAAGAVKITTRAVGVGSETRRILTRAGRSPQGGHRKPAA